MNTAKNVFLIEDDESDTYFFIEAIKEIKDANLYDTACNGIVALQKLQGATTLPDIIFSDIHMPQMDGVACLKEIRNNPVLCDIPVVILSSDVANLDTVRQLGASAFIKKPNDGQHLREQIEQLIYLDFKTDLFAANFTFEIALR